MFGVKLPQAVPLSILPGLVLFLCSCGNSNPINALSTANGNLSILPARAVLDAGKSLQFSAASNATAGDLEWLVNGVRGGSSTSGTISVSGLYTAPQVITSNAAVVVAAMSEANPLEAGSADVTVMPTPSPVTVSLSPPSASLQPDGMQRFVATVQGTSDQNVNWFVNGDPGGNADLGTVSSAGTYTAPANTSAPLSVTVTATSAYDSASSGQAAVTVAALSTPAVPAPPAPAPPSPAPASPAPSNPAPAPSSPAPPPSSPAPPAAPSHTAWDPGVLGVLWASDFAKIAKNEINVQTDSRLKVKAAGDGNADDTAAIRAAIQVASSTGGGVVYLPAGNYRTAAASDPSKANPIIVPSRVILRGAGSSSSIILLNDSKASSETDGTWTWGGISFSGSSLSGMTDIGVTANTVPSSSSPCATVWNRGSKGASEVFFNNVSFELNNCRAFWLEGVNNLLVKDSEVDSSENNSRVDQVGPVYIADNSNVSLVGNKLTYNFGRVHLSHNDGLSVQGNTFIRDALNKDADEKTAIESGGVEVSFVTDLQMVNNTVQTLNAPAGEAGDGEAIMSQHATTQDILDAGTATSLTSTTLTDSSALWGPVTVSRLAQFPQTVVVILSGPATGEMRTVESFTPASKTLTVTEPWNPVPAAGSQYTIFGWTLMNANIQENTLIDNPNGIWMYDGCYNCVIQDNKLMNSRGILLRVVDEITTASAFPEGRRIHEVAMNNRVVNNTVSNTSGVRPAFVALDTEAFAPNGYSGMGMINVQVGGNAVNPNPNNPNQTYPNPVQDEITQDGFFPCFFYGPASVKAPVDKVFQNINYWSNTQSTNVNYGPSVSAYATHACVTPAAPANP